MKTHTHKPLNNTLMQPILLYPFSTQAIANAERFELTETVHELEQTLEANGFQLISLSFTNQNEDETIWRYSIKVPGICFSEAERVIETIALFWDFNRMDDQIHRSTLDYKANMLHLKWAVSC